MIPDQIIAVFGNVKFPGRYPLVNNASVKKGLASAGGLQGLTYEDEIDITRKLYERSFSKAAIKSPPTSR